MPLKLLRATQSWPGHKVIFLMFTVKISKSENVSILKDLIKEKNPSSLGNVDVKNIDLWQVSVLMDDLYSKKPSTAGLKLSRTSYCQTCFPRSLLSIMSTSLRVLRAKVRMISTLL